MDGEEALTEADRCTAVVQDDTAANRFPAATRSLRSPRRSASLTVAAAFTSIPAIENFHLAAAMTSDRPYRKKIDPAAPREELAAERGRQFDPRVVDTFLALLDNEPWDPATPDGRR